MAAKRRTRRMSRDQADDPDSTTDAHGSTRMGKPRPPNALRYRSAGFNHEWPRNHTNEEPPMWPRAPALRRLSEVGPAYAEATAGKPSADYSGRRTAEGGSDSLRVVAHGTHEKHGSGRATTKGHQGTRMNALLHRSAGFNHE